MEKLRTLLLQAALFAGPAQGMEEPEAGKAATAGKHLYSETIRFLNPGPWDLHFTLLPCQENQAVQVFAFYYAGESPGAPFILDCKGCSSFTLPPEGAAGVIVSSKPGAPLSDAFFSVEEERGPTEIFVLRFQTGGNQATVKRLPSLESKLAWPLSRVRKGL